MKKYGIWTGILLVLACTVVIGILLPYMRAGSAMPGDGVLTLRQREDGRLLLSWPEADRADRYMVQILRAPGPENQNEEELYSEVTDQTENLLLPELPLEEALVFRVNSAVDYLLFGRKSVRYGASPLEVTVQLRMPAVTGLDWFSESGDGRVQVTYQLENADSCTAYLVDENGVPAHFRTLTDTNWVLQFGDAGELPVPAVGERCHFVLAACRKTPGMDIYGMVTAELILERQDLMGRDLNVVFLPEEDHGFTLTWDETQGEYYEIQQLGSDDQWVTVCRIEQGEERCYVSGPLAKFCDFYYRVVAVGGHGADANGYAAQSDIIHFATKASPMYALVWPVKDLDAYFDAKKTGVYTTAKTGKAYCVVDEKNGMFGVRIGDQICYIDSNYCMINLPDYIGDLCSYQITNSTSSVYRIHDLEIPRVTKEITQGYENVYQADGSYLVPLLYPTAKKLADAAQEAVSRGYCLRIYDSFRPQSATREIYDRTAAILDQLVSPEGMTYRQVMTDGKYSLSSFLARGTSRHNLGVALDLTLEDFAAGEALGMQTAMHDLSWYSVTSRNNANAKTLASIMTSAGFAGLSTEWWHFQDDEAKNQLSLPAVRDGVSAEGWTCDARGWRYRDGRGVYVQDGTVQTDGNTYTFDENGYLMDGQPAFG